MYSTHNHFESLFDTANNLKAMLLEFINAGFTKVAVTDHGEATAFEDLLKILDGLKADEKKKQKEDPTYQPDERILNFELVFGVEGYLKDDINPKNNSHIILIAKDYEGYHNLCRVITESNRNLQGTKGKTQPIITMDNLKQNITKDHVYCTSACIGGTFGHLFALDKLNIEEKLAKIDDLIDDEGEKIKSTKARETKRLALEESLRQFIEREEHETEIADNFLAQMKEIFGEKNFFFEIQNHFIEKEKIIYNKVIRYALNHHPFFIAANDVHVGVTKDNPNFDMAIKARNISKSRRFNSYKPDTEDEQEYYIKTNDELKEALLQLNDGEPYTINGKEIPLENIVDKAIKNTCLLKSCNIEFPKETYYPKFNPDWTEEQTKDYFIKKIQEGKEKLFPNGFPTEEYQKRLEYEIEVISSMGYIDYHLIVQEYNQYAKTLGNYVVGPGRGSAAGSLACYCLGITEIDPIQYGLLFERFLNVDRVSMPDIDMDFANCIRDDAIQHVVDKYGIDKVCRIVTKSYSKANGSLREVGRYLGRIDCFEEGVTAKSDKGKELFKPHSNLADTICKSISGVNKKDNELFDMIEDSYIDPEDVDDESKTQSDILEEDNEFFNTLETNNNEEALELTKLAKSINGLFMSYGTHACGVIVSSIPIENVLPLRMSELGLETSCAFPLAENRGLLKEDFLGLMTLDILNDYTVLTGDENIKDIVKANKILEDKTVYEHIFSNGLTSGVFQMASSGMMKMLKEFRPSCFEDIILLVAAYRPGPMDFLDGIIATKKYQDGRSTEKPKPVIDINCKELQDIIAPTYGAIIYQEQVMQIFQTLAGYTLGQADLVRRAMSKKHEEELLIEQKAFVYGDKDRGIEGCINKVGMTEQEGLTLFDQMINFAKYAFNKSHAAAYAKLTVFTAYALHKNPQMYFVSYLNHTKDEKKRLKLLKEASKHGLTILPPTIDHGFSNFEPIGTNQVRFGSSFIKDMSYDEVNYPDDVESLFLMGLSEKKVSTIVRLGLVKEIWHDQEHRIYNGHIDEHFLSVFEQLKPLYVRLTKKKDGLFDKINELKNVLITEPLTNKQQKSKERYLEKYQEERDEILEKIINLRNTAYEHQVVPYSSEEILALRKAEYESLGCPFFQIEEDLKKLETTTSIDKRLEDTEKSILINVNALVISVSDLQFSKKGNPFYQVALMLKNGKIIERRFEHYPTELIGQFSIYSEAGKWFITPGIAKPLQEKLKFNTISSLFGVNTGVILNFAKCDVSHPLADKIIEDKDIMEKEIKITDFLTLLNVTPTNEEELITVIKGITTRFSQQPVLLPFTNKLNNILKNYDFDIPNLFYVDVKTGRFFDLNLNERKDLTFGKEIINARQ